MPVDHPLVPVLHGTCAKAGRVRARDLRLRHREERAHIPGDERPEPALLLLVRPEVPEDLSVAGVGRLAAEDQLRPDRAADLLVQVRIHEEAPVGAARLGRQVRRPQTLLLDEAAEMLDELVRRFVLLPQRALVRIDVLLHEGPDTGPELEHLVGGTEIGDRHPVSIAGS